jgi:hypothetical protein
MADVPVDKRALKQVELEELAEVLEGGLRRNFSTASVSVVECPDLSLDPWGLASQGICGSPRLADVGGVPYLFPLPRKEKVTYTQSEPLLIEIMIAILIE